MSVFIYVLFSINPCFNLVDNDKITTYITKLNKNAHKMYFIYMFSLDDNKTGGTLKMAD